jgi:pimeloyl-ACP methyl ester carboxylesterase
VAALVLIHGAGEDARIWERQIARFAAAHRVLAVDLPGRRTRRDEPPFEAHADNAADVAAQMTRAGIERGIVVGHSMGGAVALMMALEHAERGATLVLVATGARLKMHPDFLDKARRRAGGVDADGGPLVPIERTVAAGTAARDVQWIAERAMSAPPATTYADFRANDRFDVMARLGGITAPTLVIGAEEDRMAPPKFSEFLAARIPGARLVILPACGHYPQVEQQAAFDRALAEFIAEA